MTNGEVKIRSGKAAKRRRLAALTALFSIMLVYIVMCGFSFDIYLALNGVYDNNIADVIGVKLRERNPFANERAGNEYRIYVTDKGFFISREILGIEIDASGDGVFSFMNADGRFVLHMNNDVYSGGDGERDSLSTDYIFGSKSSYKIEPPDGVTVLRTSYGKNELIVINNTNTEHTQFQVFSPSE